MMAAGRVAAAIATLLLPRPPAPEPPRAVTHATMGDALAAVLKGDTPLVLGGYL